MRYLIILAVLLLYGCDQLVCNSPYIQVGGDCCLDTDGNKICDKDEQARESTEIVVTEEKPKIVPTEVKVTKYVCSDGSVVDMPEKCPVEESTPKEEEIVIPELDKNNEEGSLVEKFEVNPACQSGENGGLISFKVGTVPASMVIQVKEVGSDYVDILTKGGLYNGYVSFAICDTCRGVPVDFKLKPGKAYILKAKFDHTKVYNRIEYSNEYLVDTRAESEYMLKLCKNL